MSTRLPAKPRSSDDMFPPEVMLGEIVAVLKWLHFSEAELANIAHFPLTL